MNQSTHPLTQNPKRLSANQALLLGIAASFLFTALVWWSGQRLESVPLLPDQGAAWYYWKLPEPTFWTRFSAWGLYLLHQLALWGLIYTAQNRALKYTAGLHPINWIALGVNGLFIILRVVQSQIWYDGLAQDTPIWSSQGSVIVMLVWILLMENSRRGLFFGKKVPIGPEIVRFARKNHGYIFAWASIYTFWFHPTIATSGHLLGFLYMFLLLVQGSLFFTRAHLNKWWTASLEVMVLVHGAIVAVLQGNGLWPMFAFGFGGIFVITQMHGLGLSRLARAALLAVYIGLALWIYAGRGWGNLNEIIRIPVIEYLAVLLLALLIGGGLRLARLFKRLNRQPSAAGPHQSVISEWDAWVG